MPVRETIRGNATKALVWADSLEETCREQIANLVELPIIHSHVAVMPDAHAGIGSTVGTVIATKASIIPAAVGVDIGCGMIAGMTSLTANDLPDNLAGLRSAIEAAVPHGRTDNGGRNDKGAWLSNPPDDVVRLWWQAGFADAFEKIAEKTPEIGAGNVNHVRHMGTLGTGNHFIEVCLDEDSRVWVVLHSGSRGVGNRIGSVFIEKAKKHAQSMGRTVPHTDLSYLVEADDLFHDYTDAMMWAQDFALYSRHFMFGKTIAAMRETLGRDELRVENLINCHHNYADVEFHFGEHVWVTRKGAIRAKHDDLGVIPGSMGDRSYIVRGRQNECSFHSCSHGAGRVMSRAKARKAFTVDDLERATKGIECRKDESVLDEIPMAYKSIDRVMENQTDLVEIVHTLRQVVNIKG